MSRFFNFYKRHGRDLQASYRVGLAAGFIYFLFYLTSFVFLPGKPEWCCT